MTPVPLLVALLVKKIREYLGYDTEGRCPVTINMDELEMKDSESKQKLVKHDVEKEAHHEVKPEFGVNGCPVKGHA